MNAFVVNCFETYERRADLVRKALIEAGYDTKILTSDFEHFGKKRRADNKEGYVFFHAPEYKKNISFARLLSHKKLAGNIFRFIRERAGEVDLLWVIIPPNSFAKEAAALKRQAAGIRLIFDLMDLWPETMPVSINKNAPPFSAWRSLRDNNLPFADLVVTECRLFENKIKNTLPDIKSETLYMTRPLLPYEPVIDLPEDTVELCYLGSVNNIIDIETIAEIIELISKTKKVRLHIIGDGENREKLISTSKAAGASVAYHGAVFDRAEKQRILDKCHYGLNIMKPSVFVGLTMKSLDYLDLGLPMINNIKGDTWDFIEKHKIGINFERSDGFQFTEYDIDMRARARAFFENNLSDDMFCRRVRTIASVHQNTK